MSALVTDLSGHLALVTGASGGIGKATCRALAKMGCSIAVHYHSQTQAAEELIQELKGYGVRAEAFKADLSNFDEVGLTFASSYEKSEVATFMPHLDSTTFPFSDGTMVHFP